MHRAIDLRFTWLIKYIRKYSFPLPAAGNEACTCTSGKDAWSSVGMRWIYTVRLTTSMMKRISRDNWNFFCDMKICELNIRLGLLYCGWDSRQDNKAINKAICNWVLFSLLHFFISKQRTTITHIFFLWELKKGTLTPIHHPCVRYWHCHDLISVPSKKRYHYYASQQKSKDICMTNRSEALLEPLRKCPCSSVQCKM